MSKTLAEKHPDTHIRLIKANFPALSETFTIFSKQSHLEGAIGLKNGAVSAWIKQGRTPSRVSEEMAQLYLDSVRERLKGADAGPELPPMSIEEAIPSLFEAPTSLPFVPPSDRGTAEAPTVDPTAKYSKVLVTIPKSKSMAFRYLMEAMDLHSIEV